MIYEIHLSEQQLKIISDALVMMPYRSVAELIAEINKQLLDQQKNEEARDKDGNA